MSQITLKRSLSLPLITFYGLGTILGAGIYVLVGEVVAEAGMAAPVSFLIASIIAGLTAFSYAELSSRYPLSAGEAVYLENAFHKSWLTSLTGWSVVLVGTISAATIANGFVGYLDLFYEVPGALAITFLILSLGAIAAWGITESVWLATLITLIEIAGLILVLIVAGDSLQEISGSWDQILPSFSVASWSGILLGAYLSFYAFIGFEDMVNVAEEVKNPQKNLPRSIFLALGLATIFYCLISLVAVLALPTDVLAQSKAPLARIVESRGYSSTVIGLISLTAIVNGALVQIIMASRVLYGMSCQKKAPEIFSEVSPKTRTPLLATLLITFAVLVLALWFPLVTLAKMTSFVTLSIFAVVNVALWWIKRTHKNYQESGISYPMWIPVCGFFACLAFIALQMVNLLAP